MITNEKIINKEAYDLGLTLSAFDRKLIRDKVNVVPAAVDVVLSGRRRAVRGKSLQIVELARRIAEINKQKDSIITESC